MFSYNYDSLYITIKTLVTSFCLLQLCTTITRDKHNSIILLTSKLASINHYSASSLKDLKPSLLSCGSQLWDSSEHLGKAIELGLQIVVGEDKPAAKRRKSVSKSPQNISVCLEVIQTHNQG